MGIKTSFVNALRITGSLFGTASYSSHATSASVATSAATASYALFAASGGGFPYTGSASLTGSLLVDGKLVSLAGKAGNDITRVTVDSASIDTNIRDNINVTTYVEKATANQVEEYLTEFRNLQDVKVYEQVVSAASYSVSHSTVVFETTEMQVTGSLLAANITGSLFGTASYASTASYINITGSNIIVNYRSGSIELTGSAQVFPFTGSAVFSGSIGLTGSMEVVSGSITGSLFGTASYASTASYLNTLNQDLQINGAVFVNGPLTASIFVTQFVTSSVSVVTGSTQFGSILENTHEFTGSVSITGSLNVIGNGITGSLLGTASYVNLVAGENMFVNHDGNGKISVTASFDQIIPTGSLQARFIKPLESYTISEGYQTNTFDVYNLGTIVIPSGSFSASFGGTIVRNDGALYSEYLYNAGTIVVDGILQVAPNQKL